MNLVEIWFGIVERQAIHRGTFGNVRDLTTAIRTYINGWNNRAHPFVWTKTADKSSRKPTAKPLQTRATRNQLRSRRWSLVPCAHIAPRVLHGA